MKIRLNSVMVENQDTALKFYTEVLGFVKKNEISVGEYRWLTVVSPGDRMKLNWCWSRWAFRPRKRIKKHCSIPEFL